jgi:hypothetical protein
MSKFNMFDKFVFWLSLACISWMVAWATICPWMFEMWSWLIFTRGFSLAEAEITTLFFGHLTAMITAGGSAFLWLQFWRHRYPEPPIRIGYNFAFQLPQLSFPVPNFPPITYEEVSLNPDFKMFPEASEKEQEDE